ncbi:MAG: HAD family phosphatase [Alphaproteobacteria bacterium]|nr:HAD family phosphatase [Alphaproteobacteria bacterium]
MSNIELIIFDFDGVIADSEYLFIKADRNAFAHAGIEMSEYDITHKFIGMDFDSISKSLINQYGAERTTKYTERMLTETERLIQSELTAVPHVVDFIENTKLPYFVASNGTTSKTQQKMATLKIEHLFEHVIIGTNSVKKPKPAPDMFKLAADKAGVAYDKCAVIEDGVYGIQAATTLNMKPIGFTGASHILDKHAQNLTNAGAILTFDDMSELHNILESL